MTSFQQTAARAAFYADDRTTRTFLTCGVAAGPLFMVVGLIQAFTIPGFDLTHHYLSMLSSSPDLGWIQISNFVASGLLVFASAVGVRRALCGGPLGRVSPVLLGLFGVGLAAAGVFVADPALGYPPGTPDTIPTNQSWHSILHGVSAVVSFTFLAAACVTLGYRFFKQRQRGWAAYSVLSGIVAFGMPSIPNPWGGMFLFVAAGVGFAWLAAVCLKLSHELRA